MAGLTDYIQQGQTQQVVAPEAAGMQGGPPVSEAITPIAEAVQPVTQAVQPVATQIVNPEPAGEAASAAVGNTEPSGTTPSQGQQVTTPDPRDDAIRTLQEQLQAQANDLTRIQQQQAAESARREEAAILARIQQIPDEQDRQSALYNYQLNKQQAIIQAQRTELQSREQRDQLSQQEVAKNSVVTIRAMQEGIPSEYIPLLRKADSPEELESSIKLLKGTVAQQQQVQQETTRQEIVDSGVYAAGGTQAGFVPPEMPKERSGDLAGLIAATPPRFG
jgi:hypothetical protein